MISYCLLSNPCANSKNILIMLKSIIFVTILALCSSEVHPVQTHWICTDVPSDEWTRVDCAYGTTYDASHDVYHATEGAVDHESVVYGESHTDDLHSALNDNSMDIALMILNMPDSMRVSVDQLHIPGNDHVAPIEHGEEVVIQQTEEAVDDSDKDVVTTIGATVVTHQNWGHHKLQYKHASECQQIWVDTPDGTTFHKHCRVCNSDCDNCGADDEGC